MNFDNSNNEFLYLFICDLCGKTFHLKINYKNHMKIHNKNCFYCSYPNCYKKFYNQFNKENHERIFHEEMKDKRPNTLKNTINRIMENINSHFIDYSRFGVNILNQF